MAQRLAGKVAIVTGAGSRGPGVGNGKAAAILMAREGARVLCVDAQKERAEETVGLIAAEQGVALAFSADVTRKADCEAMVAEAVGRWGGLDILHNNVGIESRHTLMETTEDEWDRTIDTHLKGAFNWCKVVAPAMLGQRAGRIVNMSSVSAHTGAGTAAVSKSAYCAAKAGILGLTRGLAKELAPHVTVNAICPGLIATDLTAGMIAREGAENLVRAIPLARLGTPEDIAQVVVFLATMTPCFMTGEVIDVDGGQWVN